MSRKSGSLLGISLGVIAIAIAVVWGPCAAAPDYRIVHDADPTPAQPSSCSRTAPTFPATTLCGYTTLRSRSTDASTPPRSWRGKSEPAPSTALR